jgi:uncharacterized protein YndB with AHSA1/START domain
MGFIVANGPHAANAELTKRSSQGLETLLRGHLEEGQMTSEERDFRSAAELKKAPKAVADGAAGMLLDLAEISGTPDQVFRALMTDEVERWWTIPGVYRLRDWKADLQRQGHWSVTVELRDGKQLNEWGEFCEIDAPRKIVMTRRFGANPLLGERETTLTYRLEPSPHGTLLTLKGRRIPRQTGSRIRQC